jgi:DNA-binding transcriptional ArsR family regulator
MTQIKDAAVLKALAHPLRRRLIDVLRVDGPSMPSVLARATGQAVANISHHLRVLADAGLLVEAPELARNRKEHWWRLVDARLSWNPDDFAPEVADAAESIGLQRQIDLISGWLSSPAARGEPWQDSSFSTDVWLRLSPAELAELGAEIQELIGRYHGRPESPGREPVFVLSRGFPARPCPAGPSPARPRPARPRPARPRPARPRPARPRPARPRPARPRPARPRPARPRASGGTPPSAGCGWG